MLPVAARRQARFVELCAALVPGRSPLPRRRQRQVGGCPAQRQVDIQPARSPAVCRGTDSSRQRVRSALTSSQVSNEAAACQRPRGAKTGIRWHLRTQRRSRSRRRKRARPLWFRRVLGAPMAAFERAGSIRGDGPATCGRPRVLSSRLLNKKSVSIGPVAQGNRVDSARRS